MFACIRANHAQHLIARPRISIGPDLSDRIPNINCGEDSSGCGILSLWITVAILIQIALIQRSFLVDDLHADVTYIRQRNAQLIDQILPEAVGCNSGQIFFCSAKDI